MKYIVKAVVSDERLADVVQAIVSGGINYDPQLNISSLGEERQPKERRVIVPIPVERAKRTNAPVGKRAELVEAILKTGPKRWGDMRSALGAGGLSESSLNSLLGKWKKERRIQRSADGLWSLVENAKAANA